MDGVIVASDIMQEWLLPWWWSHYIKFNSMPVAFIDLGLSMEMKKWCQNRGKRIRLREFDFAAGKEELDESTVQQMEDVYGTEMWPSRNAWFKKPLACLETPFQRSIWVDLDCEVRGSLHELFVYADHTSGIAMAKDQHDPPNPYPIYNSGVFVFNKVAPLLKQWADACFMNHRSFRGDQEVFSDLIGKNKISIGELPSCYNWSRCLKDHRNVVVFHWHGEIGKRLIRRSQRFAELAE